MPLPRMRCFSAGIRIVRTQAVDGRPLVAQGMRAFLSGFDAAIDCSETGRSRAALDQAIEPDRPRHGVSPPMGT